jgi:uncharacterized protein (TIGR02594 family)
MNPRIVHADDPAYLKAAFSKLGLSEIAGPENEPQVLVMYKVSGHPEISDDETAWCAAFVGWCLWKGGLPNTGSLMAKSYAKYGTDCDLGETVPRGAILVWTRQGGGHVNFCLGDDGTYVTCIGGNQENGRGGGVTISRRIKAQAVAARLPKSGAVVMPKPKPKPAVVLPPVEQPDDPGVEPEAAPKPKTGITEGAKVGAGIGVAGVLSQVWDAITQAPDAILQALLGAAQKPAFLLFVGVIAAGGFIWWRRKQQKAAS